MLVCGFVKEECCGVLDCFKDIWTNFKQSCIVLYPIIALYGTVIIFVVSTAVMALILDGLGYSYAISIGSCMGSVCMWLCIGCCCCCYHRKKDVAASYQSYKLKVLGPDPGDGPMLYQPRPLSTDSSDEA